MAKENVMPSRLPLHLLEEITNHFSQDRVLGSGAYGKVYLGVHRDGQKIAVKLLFDEPGHGNVQYDKEFENLTSLQHENIVRLVGYCHETMREIYPYNGKMVLADVTKRALCFEFMKSGSLDKYLSDEHSGHNWCVRYTLIKGICNGLKYLHEELKPPIYHLDLKPANILLDENMIPKIADFGLSRFFSEEKTQVTRSPIGTLGYLPPEFINQNIISNKLDIFSLGVVMVKIIAGPEGHTHSAEMSADQFIDIVHGNWRNRLQAASEGSSYACLEQVKRCIEIALSCMEADRRKRPTIGNVFCMLNETESTNSDQGALINQVDRKGRNNLQVISGGALEPYSEHADTRTEEALGCVVCHGPTTPTIPTILNETETLKCDHGPLIDQMSSCMVKETKLINVHPLLLHFHFRPNTYITCPIHVTNNLDHRVAVRVVSNCKNGTTLYHNVRSLHGLVPAKAAYTFTVTMETGEQQQQDQVDLSDLFLEFCEFDIRGGLSVGMNDPPAFFKHCKDENKRYFNELTIRAICTNTTYDRMAAESIRPILIVVRKKDEEDFGQMTAIDLHPTYPWVMAGYWAGYVAIWNYETEARLIILNLETKVTPSSVRFIPRMQLIVVGDSHGDICVYSYPDTSSTCAHSVLEFRAHDSEVNSLAVHPTQPFVLSASQDQLIKLWDWEKDWACIRTFVGHSRGVEEVKFSPHDGTTFASASSDGTVKIWSIFSANPVTTLDPQEFCGSMTWVDYFPTSTDGDQRHYLVTAGRHGTARIWDLRSGKCIHEMDFLEHVGVLDYLGGRPVLYGSSTNNSISLRDGTNYSSSKPEAVDAPWSRCAVPSCIRKGALLGNGPVIRRLASTFS